MRPDRPMLKPWYRVVDGPGRVMLEFGGALTLIEGAAAATLVPRLLELLDGRRSYPEIVELLGRRVAPAVEAVMNALVRAGAVTEGPPLPQTVPAPAGEMAALLAATSPAGPGPFEIAARLERSRVDLVGDQGLAEALSVSLREAGVGSVEFADALSVCPREGEAGAVPSAVAAPGAADRSPADLAIVVDHDSRTAEALNRTALGSGLRWLPIQPYDGRLAGVGPLMVPGETCCWTCHRLRRASTSGYPDELEALAAAPASSFGTGPLGRLVAAAGALLALRWLAHEDAELPGVLWAIEPWPTPRITRHVVYRLPRCPDCSVAAGLAAPAPWTEET